MSFRTLNLHLNGTSPPNHGTVNLSDGFAPDPFSLESTDGGPVNVSYLGGSCEGFTTVAPTVRTDFGAGTANLLRIYDVGNEGDAKLVINDPFGNFYCVDNSFTTTNPTIDFNNPAGGSYDVWVCSETSAATLASTLFVTQKSGNHP